MSYPAKITDVQRRLLADADAGMWPPFKGAVEAAIARLDCCEAELAALAPLQDLLKDVREDNELRRAAEIGAAREREACALAMCSHCRPDEDGDTTPLTEDKLSHIHAQRGSWACRAAAIRRRGPCLPPLPDEDELERLLNIEKAARQMVDVAACSWEEAAEELRRTLAGKAFQPLT